MSAKAGFFALDRRVWAKLCERGSMNEAIAYLVLACGTGLDNRSTAWSTQAVSTYAGMGIEPAKQAIERLIGAAFGQFGERHTRTKPRYVLVWPDGTEDDSGYLENLIWVPNTIVTGTSRGETSPIQRLRSAGDLWALRLFIELYDAHNLRDERGISPRVLWEPFERIHVADQGIYTVWGFKRARQRFLNLVGPFAAHRNRKKNGTAEETPAWQSVNLLEQLGLLTFVPHILENEQPEAQAVHPYGIGRSGEEALEAQIGEAADEAGRAMAAWRISAAENEGFEHFCPILRSLPNPQMVGIARLRYRPHTARTSAWFAQLQEEGPRWLETFESLAQQAATTQTGSFSMFG